jgi:hypothetical protein
MFFISILGKLKEKKVVYRREPKCEKRAGGTLCESMRQLKELKSITIQFD